jgi:hypothetical protein
MDTFVKNLTSGTRDALASGALLAEQHLKASSWRIAIPSLVVGYLTLVQLLRFRALRKMRRKYAAYAANPYSLNYKQAQEIMRLPLLYDHPFLFAFGTQWALVKSYGIASGTPLLVKTRQLADPRKVGKRAEDTGVFISELLCGDMDSQRGRLVFSKLNWLHNCYDIAEGDFVHTLALFVLEPQRWIDRFGWRPLTKLERVAHLVYWREIGHRMGFGGIPATLEDLEAWKAEYEKTNLYYIPENRIVTDATVDLFLRSTPKFMHGFMRAVFVAFIDEKKVRDALGYGDPSTWAVVFTTVFFKLRGFVLRHFFLPRASMLDPLAKAGPDGRLYRSADFVGFEPWYVPDTWYNRLMVWISSGGKLEPSDKFRSNGFLPEELGPIGTEKVSREAVYNQAKAMEDYVKKGGSVGMGCPFSFGG